MTGNSFTRHCPLHKNLSSHVTWQYVTVFCCCWKLCVWEIFNLVKCYLEFKFHRLDQWWLWQNDKWLNISSDLDIADSYRYSCNFSKCPLTGICICTILYLYFVFLYFVILYFWFVFLIPIGIRAIFQIAHWQGFSILLPSRKKAPSVLYIPSVVHIQWQTAKK